MIAYDISKCLVDIRDKITLERRGFSLSKHRAVFRLRHLLLPVFPSRYCTIRTPVISLWQVITVDIHSIFYYKVVMCHDLAYLADPDTIKIFLRRKGLNYVKCCCISDVGDIVSVGDR